MNALEYWQENLRKQQEDQRSRAKELLHNLNTILNQREIGILEMRYGLSDEYNGERDFKSIAKYIGENWFGCKGVTTERIRQIESRARRKLESATRKRRVSI